jgi:hypothetical protein
MSTSTVTTRASVAGSVTPRSRKRWRHSTDAAPDRDLELDLVAVADRPAVVDFGAHGGQPEVVLPDEGRIVRAHHVAEVLLHADVAEVQVAREVDDPGGVQVAEADLEAEAVAHRGPAGLPRRYWFGQGTSTP